MSETLAEHEPYKGKDLGEIAFICTPTMVEGLQRIEAKVDEGDVAPTVFLG